MRFCCGVTLFYPTESELQSIITYKDSFDTVFIYDNTDDDSIDLNRSFFSSAPNIIFMSNNHNDGLSKAFNVICNRAIDNSFDFICLFDQDSYISPEDLRKMFSFIQLQIGGEKDVAIVAPKVVFKHIKNENNLETETHKEISWAISSGSFINLSVYKQTEGFDENYFIDRLDFDYCYNLRRAGYKIIQYCESTLYQNLGETKVVFKKSISQHSAVRHYYMSRNRMYFFIKKSNFSVKATLLLVFLSIKQLATIVLYESNKVNKLRMAVRGGKDFLLNRMGRLN